MREGGKMRQGSFTLIKGPPIFRDDGKMRQGSFILIKVPPLLRDHIS